MKIGVMGCGNMASAIAKGIYNSFPEIKFYTYTPSQTRAKKLAEEVSGKFVFDLKEFESVDKIIIACKPQQFHDLSKSLKDQKIDFSKKHIISIMASISLDKIMRELESLSVTRIMPNTPILNSQGISLFLHSSGVSFESQDNLEKLFKSVSKVYRIDTEENFDKITLVSGSGPAYIFLLFQIFSLKLQEWGMNEKDSIEMFGELLKGSISLVEKRGEESLQELIDKVTSKGGVTIEAVKSLRDESNLSDIISKALEGGIARSLEISREFSSF